MTEGPSALRRWMVGGPEVSRLATEYKTVSEAKDANEKVRHQEQTARAQLQFFEKVRKLCRVRKLEIPFKKKQLVCSLLTQR